VDDLERTLFHNLGRNGEIEAGDAKEEDKEGVDEGDGLRKVTKMLIVGEISRKAKDETDARADEHQNDPKRHDLVP